MRTWAGGKRWWAVLLPCVAVLLTTMLVVASDHQERVYYSTHHIPLPPSVNDYSPYPLLIAFLVNGPFFFPLPIPMHTNVPFADRLLSVGIGWFCIGMYLDWKRHHTSTQLIQCRRARLALFAGCSAVFICLAAVLANGTVRQVWRADVPFTTFWMMRFQTRLGIMLSYQFWLILVAAWSIRNLYRSYKISTSSG